MACLRDFTRHTLERELASFFQLFSAFSTSCSTSISGPTTLNRSHFAKYSTNTLDHSSPVALRAKAVPAKLLYNKVSSYSAASTMYAPVTWKCKTFRNSIRTKAGLKVDDHVEKIHCIRRLGNRIRCKSIRKADVTSHSCHGSKSGHVVETLFRNRATCVK